jgi:hypothetical protein
VDPCLPSHASLSGKKELKIKNKIEFSDPFVCLSSTDIDSAMLNLSDINVKYYTVLVFAIVNA